MKNVALIGSEGYIGSFVAEKLLENKDKYTCKFVDLVNIGVDYADLPESFFEGLDAVILLAGNSSVKQCENNYYGTFNNNVLNFVNLCKKIETVDNNIRLIYASSGSVYGHQFNCKDELLVKDFRPTSNYDLSKYIIDLLASQLSITAHGLRFGTVCGVAPTFRTDLVLNAMTLSAVNAFKIHVYEPFSYRALVSLVSIWDKIEALIDESREMKVQKTHNVYDINDNMLNMAKSIKGVLFDYLGYHIDIIVDGQKNNGYSFSFNHNVDYDLYETFYCHLVNDIVDNQHKIKKYVKRDEPLIY